MAELTDKARKLFEAPNLLYVATVNQDGSPQVTPVWTHVENGNVTFNTAKGRVKARNLERQTWFLQAGPRHFPSRKPGTHREWAFAVRGPVDIAASSGAQRTRSRTAVFPSGTTARSDLALFRT